MSHVNESDVEEAALEWLQELAWGVAHGPDISPNGSDPERGGYDQVVLGRRLGDALARLNPALPFAARDDALRRLTRPEGPTREVRNREFHRMLVEGVTVEYGAGDGTIRGAQARVIDFDDPAANDWLAVNQFTVTENKHTRRPDVMLFVNGLPLGVIRAKEPGRRGRHHLDRLEPASDLQGRTALPLRHERDAHRLGRHPGAHGHAHSRAGVAQALAHHCR